MKDSIKREQNEFNGFAERVNLRTKCKEIKYQQKYVRKLVDETIDLLRLSGHRKTLIFKAPTGSGKTVMASQLLADLTEELQSRGDSPYQQVAYLCVRKIKNTGLFKPYAIIDQKSFDAEIQNLKKKNR